MRDAAAAVKEVLGASGDQDVVDYMVGVLEDESFEFGDDAAEAFEALGPLLVRGGGGGGGEGAPWWILS